MLKTLLLVVTLMGWGVADARDYADQQADSRLELIFSKFSVLFHCSQYWPGWSGKQMQMTNGQFFSLLIKFSNMNKKTKIPKNSDIFQPIVDSSDYDPFFFHSFVHPYFKK